MQGFITDVRLQEGVGGEVDGFTACARVEAVEAQGGVGEGDGGEAVATGGVDGEEGSRGSVIQVQSSPVASS